jgi:molecular chaperone GrpE
MTGLRTPDDGRCQTSSLEQSMAGKVQDQQQPEDIDVDAEPGTAVPPDDHNMVALLGEMRERWLRAEAENANVRSRARRDIEDARNFGQQKFAGDMVDAAENLKRGLDSLPAETPEEPRSLSGLRSGLIEIERSFVDVLQRNGVSREDPTGAVFAPEMHQAIGHREVSTQPAGTVAHAVSPVWTLNGRLLRPAVVLVASAPPDIAPTDPTPADQTA